MTTTIEDRFAQNLRKLRKAAGLSQEELAFRSQIHRTQISLLEGGHRLPRIYTLVKLAGALGATSNDLLEGITWEPIITVTGGLTVTPPAGEAGREDDPSTDDPALGRLAAGQGSRGAFDGDDGADWEL
ncbi:MAG: helix-turn-helix transcriptional regulator [Actinobacteria bacterium]|nr:helix-turn-helix transcriptional regulator [Actinomycetota bacterium]